jgi:hypothetical protein
MEIERLEHILNVIVKGDIDSAGALFTKPGGRNFFESVVLVVVCNLPYEQEQKEELFSAFLEAMNKIENRLTHQQEGEKILSKIWN